jgi:hypothetical protein
MPPEKAHGALILLPARIASGDELPALISPKATLAGGAVAVLRSLDFKPKRRLNRRLTELP